MSLGAPILDAETDEVPIVTDGVTVAMGYEPIVITRTATNIIEKPKVFNPEVEIIDQGSVTVEEVLRNETQYNYVDQEVVVKNEKTMYTYNPTNTGGQKGAIVACFIVVLALVVFVSFYLHRRASAEGVMEGRKRALDKKA